MTYFEFLAYVESLPQWIRFALIHYAKTGKHYGSICIDMDYIQNLKGIEKELAQYGIKAKFVRINPDVEQDSRGGKNYTHYILRLGVTTYENG